jgi:putative nucleotidyltransferase with HDIG domain
LSSAIASRLPEIIRSVQSLRPLPANTSRILQALDEADMSAAIVAELIALDQALTAYVLRVANSAAMGTRSGCSSVSEAVMRLGFKQVRSLVLSTVAIGPLSARLNGYRLGDKELWYHSIATASAAHWLASALRYPDPEEAYVAGLLHDIGKLLLDQYVLADYQQVVESMRTQRVPLWVVEEQLFGIDHAGVGGLIASHWQFPLSLVQAIRYHHEPASNPGEQSLAALVNLANALIPQDSSEESALAGRSLHPQTAAILGLTERAIEALREKLINALFTYEHRHLK